MVREAERIDCQSGTCGGVGRVEGAGPRVGARVRRRAGDRGAAAGARAQGPNGGPPSRTAGPRGGRPGTTGRPGVRRTTAPRPRTGAEPASGTIEEGLGRRGTG